MNLNEKKDSWYIKYNLQDTKDSFQIKYILYYEKDSNVWEINSWVTKDLYRDKYNL